MIRYRPSFFYVYVFDLVFCVSFGFHEGVKSAFAFLEGVAFGFAVLIFSVDLICFHCSFSFIKSSGLQFNIFAILIAVFSDIPVMSRCPFSKSDM